MEGLMQRFNIFFLTVLFILQGCSSPGHKPEQAQKNPTFVSYAAAVKPQDPYFWDFGQVKQNLVLAHEFTFKNSTDKTLNITGLNTSCGCTVSETTRKTLAPGESTQVKVQFNSKGYKGKAQQFVYVNTDNQENPVLKFTIEAFVVE
jgi:hypothetical protein